MLFCCLTGFPLFCIWDAQVRRHFQDCHHRHDERSNGAKKNESFDKHLEEAPRR